MNIDVSFLPDFIVLFFRLHRLWFSSESWIISGVFLLKILLKVIWMGIGIWGKWRVRLGLFEISFGHLEVSIEGVYLGRHGTYAGLQLAEEVVFSAHDNWLLEIKYVISNIYTNLFIYMLVIISFCLFWVSYQFILHLPFYHSLRLILEPQPLQALDQIWHVCHWQQLSFLFDSLIWHLSVVCCRF